jgi:type II secretory pathway component PulF
MSIITQPPDASRHFRATILMVTIHSFLWAGGLLGLFVWVPRAEKVLRDFNMKLPALTQLVMTVSQWVANHVPFVGLFVFFLLAVDGLSYFQLRSSAPRLISKLWSVSMFFLPIAIIARIVMGIRMPFIALPEGLSK